MVPISGLPLPLSLCRARVSRWWNESAGKWKSDQGRGTRCERKGGFKLATVNVERGARE